MNETPTLGPWNNPKSMTWMNEPKSLLLLVPNYRSKSVINEVITVKIECRRSIREITSSMHTSIAHKCQVHLESTHTYVIVHSYIWHTDSLLKYYPHQHTRVQPYTHVRPHTTCATAHMCVAAYTCVVAHTHGLNQSTTTLHALPTYRDLYIKNA